MIQVFQNKSKGYNSVNFAFSLMGLAFVALLGATWYTVKVAMAGHEPVMDINYYEKGLNYEKEIAKSMQMSKEGFRFESNIISENSILKKGINEIQVKFYKKDFPINNAKLIVTRERTATSKFTEATEIPFTSEGKYVGKVEFPHEGKWQITLSGKVNGQILDKTFMVVVE